MKKFKNRYFYYIIIFIIFFSCKKEYLFVDGSSADNFDKSIVSMSSKLTIMQQDKLKEAIKIINFFKCLEPDVDSRGDKLLTMLNGKNVDQIFEIAETIAKEQKIPWSRVSMNNFDYTIFDKSLKPLTIEEEIAQKLDRARMISIAYSKISDQLDSNPGIYLYPALIDDIGNIVEYKDIPINLKISFYCNNDVIYVMNNKITSSDVGTPSLKKGIFVPYSIFDKDKLTDPIVNVEMMATIGDKFLVGKLPNVPIDINKVTDNKGKTIEQELNKEKAQNVVNSFFSYLRKKDYSKAFALSKNKKWGTLEDFSSNKYGFGVIQSIDVISTDISKEGDKEIVIFAIYKIKDGSQQEKTLKQNFYLENKQGNWYIVNTETAEIVK